MTGNLASYLGSFSWNEEMSLGTREEMSPGTREEMSPGTREEMSLGTRLPFDGCINLWCFHHPHQCHDGWAEPVLTCGVFTILISVMMGGRSLY